MPNSLLPRLKTNRLPMLLGLALTLALAACKHTPEDAAKEMAELKCDCEDKESTLRYEQLQSLADKIKSGDIKTRTQADLYEQQGRKAVRATDSTCRAQGMELMNKIKIDFPREEDRTTLINLADALREKCEMERREKEKQRTALDRYELTKNLPE